MIFRSFYSTTNMALMESLSNSFTTLSTAIAALIVLITVTFVVRKLSDKKRYCPVAGTVFHLIFNFHRAHDYMTDLARKNKTFRILSPFRSEVFTSDPATVEYILKANFSNYGKGGHFHAVMEDMMGDGIINVDGERWLYQRKIFSHEFSTKNLKDFSSAVFQRNAEELAGTVLKVANLNKSVDIQELFLKTTLDTIFEVGFGVELDSIYGIEEGARFAKAFNDISASVLWRYVDMTWKIRKFFNIGSEASLKSNLKVIDDFLFKLIRTKLEKLSNPNHDSSIRKEDLLSRFLDLNDKDPKYLRDIVSNFLHAGRDTAAATLSWFMYRMCIHPHMQEKIAQEVKDAAQLKDTATIREYVAVVSEGHVLDKMQYLHSALSESLRLHPPVPVDAKLCFADDTFPDGFSVKKGDLVAYHPYAMGRMKFIWGEDAEEFRPERWLDQDGNFRSESPFKFPAFQVKIIQCRGSIYSTEHGYVELPTY